MIYCSNPGPVIKTTILWIILLFCLTTPWVVFAESSIQGNVINAPTKIENSANIAAGSENNAVHSSIAVKNARMSGTLANNVQSKTAVNVAAGKTNLASQGSISLSRGTVKGAVLNNVATKSTSNLAIGTDNKADQGSVRIENSRTRGTVINSSALQKSTNMAVGNSNSASQAAIVMNGAQLRGIAVNNANVENAVNAAVGYRNEANQSSIVVDGDQTDSRSTITMTQKPFPAGSDRTRQGEHSTLTYTGRKMGQNSKEQKTAQYVPGQVVFLIDNDKAGLASLDRVAKKYHLNIGEKTVLKSLNRIMVVSSTAKDAAEVAEAIKNESGVYNSQPNYVFATMGEQDPMSPMQNLVSMLDLQKVHGKVSGKNIIVAVIDTGVEIEHEDLRARIVGHHNFISGSVYHGEIHGTAVAGIIGADKNEYGIVGIAPDVSLLALRACRQVSKTLAMGECFSTSLVQSLDAAILAKVDVVNLSLGAYVNDTLLSMMIDSGHEKGIVFTAPVGNDPAAENFAFPASHDKVISVAGLNEQGNPLPNKQLAAMADAVAPATHLFVTTPGNSYNFIDGTSLAGASISGIIALSLEKINSQNPPLPPPCLPRFNSTVPWARQVLSCLGL
ncbi:MAG: S8 family serine peptidase [Pseudomonadota bacterium]